MATITTVNEFLDAIPVPDHRAKLEGLLDWVGAGRPDLE